MSSAAKEMDESQVDFTKPWNGADIVFVVDDKKVYANKIILSMSSPVFRAMFEGNFQEKGKGEISLPNKPFLPFVGLMEMLHPPYKRVECKSICILQFGSIYLFIYYYFFLIHCSILFYNRSSIESTNGRRLSRTLENIQ